jgi:hypothetical protein
MELANPRQVQGKKTPEKAMAIRERATMDVLLKTTIGTAKATRRQTRGVTRACGVKHNLTMKTKARLAGAA